MFAKVIIDITNKQVDRPFTYSVPEALSGEIKAGSMVNVPFGTGNRIRTGFVIGLTEKSDFPAEKMKSVDSLVQKSLTLEEQLLKLAIWMRERYGGTLYQSLSVALPNKVRVEARKERYFVFQGTDAELGEQLETALRKKYYARVRLLTAFQENRILPASIAADRLNITAAVLKPLAEKGLVTVDTGERTAVDQSVIRAAAEFSKTHAPVELNEEQKECVNGILTDSRPVSLLYGITGSGKTEVYLSLIEEMIRQGKESIVLIPEIALTYQTVMRFYDRFGGRVSVVHSKVSKGDRCERFQKAEDGEIKVMIGPRSALFTPFKNLGLIIIDEFHETSYQSEQIPKYSTVETAEKRAELSGARLVLGSATPSCDVYMKALTGEYALRKLTSRAVSGSVLPDVRIVDMRMELKRGNRSIFSAELKEKIQDRLQKHEQVMLFLNRRGYSGAVSCRSCGEPVKCPHCSVSLSYHRNNRLQCHICGYERNMISTCPKCGSKLIGTFGIGTEKVEEAAHESFPGAGILRMDADTTSGKDGHAAILEKFMNHEADILIGTQMIVKGHDFPAVTLVGILAADLSLNVPDYRAAERTFQLLTQAEGRAGRGKRKGECVVQTYMPDHYAVENAARQNFEGFFETEMIFRRQMKYPPAGYVMSAMLTGADEQLVRQTLHQIYLGVRESTQNTEVILMGPAEAGIYKVRDQYRALFYIKTDSMKLLLQTKRYTEELSEKLLRGTKMFLTLEG